MSTHGTLHDEFSSRTDEHHGGAEFDEGYRPAEGSDPRNDQTTTRPRVTKHGERWDEFGWEAMPARHGERFDEDFGAPSAMGGEHGTWFDVFRGGTQVRAIVGGKDIEAVVLNAHADHVVAEAKNGDRLELGLGQITSFRNVPGSRATPDRQEADRPESAAPGADAARSGALTTEHGSGPLPAAPSHGPSSSANAGHLRKAADDEVLDVLKELASEDSPPDPFDRAVREAAAEHVAKAIAPDRAARMAAKEATNRAAHPVGSTRSTTVYGIGGKSDHVTGTVVNHTGGHVHLKTEAHGVLAVEASKIGKTDDGTDLDVAKAHADTYGEAHATALRHTQDALKAAKAGRHDEAWTHHDRAMGWHAKAHMMKTAQNIAAQRSFVGKSVDATETAVQGQDLETKKPTVLTGKTWCSHCKHFCRHTDDGKCPTCGTKQSVRKTDPATDADVLKQLHDLAQEG